MFFCLLYILSALSISSIAAYFSVIGLATIFPGSIKSVIIMGGVLEVGKIVTAIWLHRNWKSSPLLIKSYLSFATLTLMAITSMGIFGFLSKAHIEHQTTTEKTIAKIEVIDNKISRENEYITRQQENINRLKSSMSNKQSTSRLDIDSENQKIKDITSQLNKDIAFEQNRIDESNNKIIKMDKALSDLESSSGGLFSSKKKKIEELKSSQSSEREATSNEIKNYNNNINSFRQSANEKINTIEEKITNFRESSSNKDTSVQPQIEQFNLKISEAYGRIDELETGKIGFADSARQLEAEVGPVKYVAEAIADLTGKEFDISQAVRIVIIILVLVFDPLAILLVIAANISIEKHFPVSKKANNKIREQYEAAKKGVEEKTLELNDLKNKIENYEVLYNKTEKDAESKKTELEMMERELRSKHEQLDELKKQSLEHNTKLVEIKNKINSKKAQVQEQNVIIKGKEDSLKIERENIISLQNNLNQKKDEISQKILKLKQESESLSKQKIDLEKDKDEIKKEIELLKEEVSAQEKLIDSLKNTYAETRNTSELKSLFKNFNLSETVCILDNSEKIVSIGDKLGRVHQFVIPTEHFDLSHKYYHSVVKKLETIENEEYLPHEYKDEMQKFIRSAPPKYNVLT